MSELKITNPVIEVMQLMYKAKKELLEIVPKALELKEVSENGSLTWDLDDFETLRAIKFNLNVIALNEYNANFVDKQLDEFGAFVINYVQNNYNIRRVVRGLDNRQHNAIVRMYNRCHQLATER